MGNKMAGMSVVASPEASMDRTPAVAPAPTDVAAMGTMSRIAKRTSKTVEIVAASRILTTIIGF